MCFPGNNQLKSHQSLSYHTDASRNTLDRDCVLCFTVILPAVSSVVTHSKSGEKLTFYRRVVPRKIFSSHLCKFISFMLHLVFVRNFIKGHSQIFSTQILRKDWYWDARTRRCLTIYVCNSEVNNGGSTIQQPSRGIRTIWGKTLLLAIFTIRKELCYQGIPNQTRIS